MRLFLGSFWVSVPVERPVSFDELLTMREVICQTFQEAHGEYIRDTRVLDSVVQPHVFVSQIRSGSLDFQVIYQGLINLPWDQISQYVQDAAGVIEKIGGIAGGLGLMRGIGQRIWPRIFGHGRDSKNLPDRGSDSVRVVHESSLRADAHALSERSIADETVHQLMHDPTPQAILTLLDEESISAIRRALHIHNQQNGRHLGGGVVIHDMNLMMNDVMSIDQLRNGNIFCLHNPAAMGLQVESEVSLFEACIVLEPDIEIIELIMDNMDFPDEPSIVEGPSIDADDLPN